MDGLEGTEILQATGGVVCGGNTSTVVTGVSTDSRKIRRGELFIPFVGEKFDGHSFIEDAVRAGATAFLTHKDVPVPEGVFTVRVGDTLEALQT